MDLARAVWDTVRWFDVFEMPVTVTQLRERLVGWRGELPRWYEVREVLDESPWLRERVEERWGYVCVRGHKSFIQERLRRHTQAQQKWKVAQRCLRVLSRVPFVRALAGSGSLAWNNTKIGSDLDVLVVAAPGRVWLARLGLLLASELMGRRRRHFDQQAPDALCLNHYLVEDNLRVVDEIQNLYTATLYSSLVPVYGGGVWQEFWRVNKDWMRGQLTWLEREGVGSAYVDWEAQERLGGKWLWEAVFLEPVWDFGEVWAEACQRFFINRHRKGQGGRVALSARELAFHPDTKVPAALKRFSQEFS